jgi:hypothetical protein
MARRCCSFPTWSGDTTDGETAIGELSRLGIRVATQVAVTA